MYNIFVGWLRSRQWPPMGWVGRMAALPTPLSTATEPTGRPPLSPAHGHSRSPSRSQPTAHIAHSTAQHLYKYIYLICCGLWVRALWLQKQCPM